MRVDGPGAWRSSKFSTKSADTTCIARRVVAVGVWTGYAMGTPRTVRTIAEGTTMAITLPELPYAYDALAPHLSAETFEYHHDKHHKAYVDTTNQLIAGTDDENASLEELIMKAEGKLFNQAAQVWNHTLYWNSMAPGGGGAPSGAAGDAINEQFGGYDAFREQFKTAATGQFGSGWTWLTYDGGQLAVSATGNADLPMKHGQTAVLTCDVWEHAYYIDYRNARPNYVDAFLDHLINWRLLEDVL
jgi:superoxide dismutase, Fe-Mn family